MHSAFSMNKLLVPGFLFLVFAALAGPANAQQSSFSCNTPNFRPCPINTKSQCTDGIWQCVSLRRSSSSSVSKCGVSNIRCMGETRPACMPSGKWQCVASEVVSQSREQCAAYCQDGYKYYTCTSDGRRIRFLDNPCKSHFKSSSSSSVSSTSRGTCAYDNYLECRRDAKPECIDGLWQCVPKIAPPAANTSGISIEYMAPLSGPVGIMVTLEGTGFAPRGNTVVFGDTVIPNILSADGKHLTFKVPARPGHMCFSKERKECMRDAPWYGMAQYEVVVLLEGKTSNTKVFTIR